METEFIFMYTDFLSMFYFPQAAQEYSIPCLFVLFKSRHSDVLPDTADFIFILDGAVKIFCHLKYLSKTSGFSLIWLNQASLVRYMTFCTQLHGLPATAGQLTEIRIDINRDNQTQTAR